MPATPNKSSPASSSRRLVVELPASRSSTRASSISTPTRARSRTASASATPVQHHHHELPHLSKADELAADEAEEILEHLEGSARSKRHERLSRLREQSHIEMGDEIVVGDPKGGDDEDVDVEEGDEIVVGGERAEDDGESVATAITLPDVEKHDGDATEDNESEADMIQSSGIVPSLHDPTGEAESEDDDVESSTVSDTTASDSGSDASDSTSDTSTDSDDSDEDDEEEELEKLLKAARIAATKPANASSAVQDVDAISGGDELVSFAQDEAEQRRRKEAPIPDIAITKLPTPHLSFTADGTAKAAEPRSIIAGPSRPRSKSGVTATTAPAPELDSRPYERKLSKREKAAQPKKATASELWSTLPAPKADLLPQMRKDYQALSLANSLDPKRFMKGGNRAGKIPDNFAIGTLVEAPRHLQDTTLTREKQYRPGQIVQDLTRDEATGSYAKRKFGDLQKTRMDNGRGNGWKKKRGW